MTEFVICQGLPASGKSTWAKEVVAKDRSWVRVNRDDLREMLYESDWDKGRREQAAVIARDALIESLLKAGKNVICDDTNLAPKVEKELRELGARCGAKVSIKDFTDVDYRECIKRDLKRARSVGAAVIMKMYDDYLRPAPAQQDPDLPHCIIVDMDGTLALFGTHRGPYEDHRSDEDDPHEYVCDFVKGYLFARPETHLIIMSGRDEGRARVATEKWLDRHGFKPTAVFMRPAGNTEHDSIIKRDLYEKFVKGRFYVEFIVDDRDQVVDLWRRDLGLNCLQVNYGNF